MKKKTLIVLLIIPFIIGLISFVSVVLLNITVASDISGIVWKYNDGTEGFKLNKEVPYKLEAEPVFDENLILATGNDLMRYVSDGEDVVQIEKGDDGAYYLVTLKEGNATIVCSNEKGTTSRSLKIVVYENGTVIINPVHGDSGQQIESTRYFGEFDVDNTSSKIEMDGLKTKKAQIEVKIQVFGDNISSQNVRVKEHTDNISFDNNVITIENANETTASLTLASSDASYITGTYNFNVVNNGVNIYNYNDLLLTTNFSIDGEISVMQTSLGSLREVYQGKSIEIGKSNNGQNAYWYDVGEELKRLPNANNIELFGNIVGKNENGRIKFNFENELFLFDTNYNSEFIDDYNQINEDKIDKKIKAGIRVQKDFYGNGYQINMDNLCFPNNGDIDTEVRRLYPNKELDYFHGPLSFVSIGNNRLEVIKAYGQDNVGMILDGDNITLNDLRIQNINDNSNKRNYAYTGTVIEVNGDNNIIKNCQIRLGKNLIRAFSSDNLLIKNSILFRSGEFNLLVGSNNYNKPDTSRSENFGGQVINFADFFDIENKSKLSANAFLEKFLNLGEFSSAFYDGEFADVDNATLNNTLRKIQETLDNTNGFLNEDGTKKFDAEITVDDCYFDESGIFSIAFETLFNGPYLYNGLSYTVKTVLGDTLNSLLPSNIGGTSAPVKLTLKGNTNFYDWKNIDDIDITNLIEERLHSFFTSLGYESDVSIDDFFPLKQILEESAKSSIFIDSNGETLLDTMVASYGGGLNLSELIDNRDSQLSLDKGTRYEVDLLTNLDKFIPNGDTDNPTSMIPKILSKCVLFAIGFNPFQFVVNSPVGDEFILNDSNPTINDLKNNLEE